jgi:hypothetical protein
MAEFLNEGFVTEDSTAFTVRESVVLLAGTIVCVDAITIDVEKQLALLGGRGRTARVQTSTFRYHAWVRGVHNILRYESGHKTHRLYPHKHEYNTFGDGRETSLRDLPDEDSIPTLGEVIREVQEWHAANASRVKRLR